MDEDEDTGVLPQDEAGGRSTEEHCIADPAAEHGLLEADHCAKWCGGRITLSYVCLHCHRFPIEDYIWWLSTRHWKKQCNWWCAACGGQYGWRNPNGVLVTQDCTDRSEAKVFRAHAPPQGASLKFFLTNQQLESDSRLQVLVEGHQEES